MSGTPPPFGSFELAKFTGLLHYLIFQWKLMKASVEASMEAMNAVEVFCESFHGRYGSFSAKRITQAIAIASVEAASTKASTEASMEVVEAST